MVSNNFVPYKESLELKEIGFDVPCLSIYTVNNEDGIEWFTIQEHAYDFKQSKVLFGVPKNYNTNFFGEGGTISAPTFSDVFEWFIKKHEIHSWVTPIVFISHVNTYESRIHKEEQSVKIIGYFETYHEAQLACVRELIKTLKDESNL